MMRASQLLAVVCLFGSINLSGVTLVAKVNTSCTRTTSHESCALAGLKHCSVALCMQGDLQARQAGRLLQLCCQLSCCDPQIPPPIPPRWLQCTPLLPLRFREAVLIMRFLPYLHQA